MDSVTTEKQNVALALAPDISNIEMKYEENDFNSMLNCLDKRPAVSIFLFLSTSDKLFSSCEPN